MDNMIFLAIDADNAGRLVGRAVLADDTEGLADVSNRIDHGQEIILSWAQTVGGQRISAGGDEATVSVPPAALEQIEMLRKDYEHATGLTITVGVGQSLSQAGKALMAGKFRGKNQVVQYDQSVESDLVAAGKNVEAGQGSEEENKLNEQYLQKEDANAAPSTHDHADCPHCQDYDAKNGGADAATCDCPYCAEYDAAQDGSTDSMCDCPYCQDYDEAQAAGGLCDCPYCEAYDAQNQHSHDNCPHCQDYDAQVAGQATPNIGNDLPPGAEAPEAAPVPGAAQAQTQEPAQPQEDKTILGGDVAGVGVDSSPQDAGPGSNQETGLDADGMIDNTSHPQGYDENTPGDMGLAEDEVPAQAPDLGQVLQGGLDNHADQIQKEKVMQMVGGALEKIKGQKQILEKAKEQAPELYTGVILMMKSMIEMAKMLGFGGDMQADPTQAPAEAAPAQNAAPQEGAAPAPKGISQ